MHFVPAASRLEPFFKDSDMRTFLAITLLSIAAAAAAQEQGYADYDQGTRADQVKAPVNVGHQVGSAINKSRRTMNDKLGALGDATLDGSQRTTMNGRDVFNVGGLVVNSEAPIQANNIIIISRPGGGGGIEGPQERQLPRRR
jgi:hypothetical protein